MTEIENKWPGCECLQYRIDRSIECCASDQQRQRIEIALNRPQLLNLLARKSKLDHPVEPNCIDGNGCDILPQAWCRRRVESR